MPTVRTEQANFPDISFTGRIGTGKSYLTDQIIKMSPTGNYQRLSFAASLKQIEQYLQTHTPFQTLRYMLSKFGNVEPWKWLTLYRILQACSKIEIETPKPRRRLQYLGNTIRERIRDSYWVEVALETYRREKRLSLRYPDGDHVHFVCEDARYPNEISALKKLGFITVKLVTDPDIRLWRIMKCYEKMDAMDPRLHAESEESTDDPRNQFDYVLFNNNDDVAIEQMRDIIFNYICAKEFMNSLIQEAQ